MSATQGTQEPADNTAGPAAKLGITGDDTDSHDDVEGHGPGHPVVENDADDTAGHSKRFLGALPGPEADDADDTEGHSIRVF